MEGFPVGLDRTVAANIEDADFAALQQEMGTEGTPDIDALVNRDSFVYRHAAHRNHAIHMGINGLDLIRLVQSVNQEFLADFLRCVALEIALVGRIANIHGGFSFIKMNRCENAGDTKQGGVILRYLSAYRSPQFRKQQHPRFPGSREAACPCQRPQAYRWQ